MSLDTGRSTLFSTFQSGFGAKQPSIPVNYENTNFLQPANGMWVAVQLLPGRSKRMGLGLNSKWRHSGLFQVTCLAPENFGSAGLTGLAESVFEVMADRIIAVPGGGQIVTYGMQRKTRGLLSGYYVITIQVEYHHDEMMGT